MGLTSSEMWLAEGLARRGHSVTVYSTGRAGARDRDRQALGDAALGAPPNFQRRSIASIPLVYNEAAVPLRVSEVVDGGTDLCLLQEDYPPLSQAVARAALRRHLPFVITCERYQDLGSPGPRLLVRGLERTVLPRMWRGSAAMTFHSRASLEFLESLGAPRDRLRYIPSCTDCDLFQPSPSGVRTDGGDLWPGGPDRVRILCAARLVGSKGLDVLIDALAIVRRARPGMACLLHGRGAGAGWIRGLVRARGLEDVLRIDATVRPISQLPELYRSSDLYVQPSRSEPFGMAALEAMACGLPLVASATGGLRDLVEDGENGILVPANDAPALARALIRMVSEPELRRRMGERSRERARLRFSLDAVAGEYDRLLAMLGPAVEGARAN